ncbi:hypothetical protein EJ05DRAFT_481113, partial [Pseudovirgaria hyperparasitica]
MVQLAWVTHAMLTSYSDFQNGSICNAGTLVLTLDFLTGRTQHIAGVRQPGTDRLL